MQPDIAPDSYSRSKCQSNVFTQCKYRRKLFHSSIMTINSCQPVERFSYKIVVVGSRFGPPKPPRDISLISLSRVDLQEIGWPHPSRFSTDGYRRCRHRRIAQRQETGIEVRGSHPLKIATGGASRFRCGGVEFLQSQRVQLIPRPSKTMYSTIAL